MVARGEPARPFRAQVTLQQVGGRDWLEQGSDMGGRMWPVSKKDKLR